MTTCSGIKKDYWGTYACARDENHLGKHQLVTPTDKPGYVGQYHNWNDDGSGSSGWIKDTDKTYNCSICGSMEIWNYSIVPLDESYCFYCNFWMQLFNSDNDGTHQAVIIGGKHYVLGDRNPNHERRAGLGSGGSTFLITLNDGTEIKNSDLWYQGSIPDHFTHLFPDNATWTK